MGKGIGFAQANVLLTAPTPEDAAAGTVLGLPVHRYRDLDGQLNVISKWQLSEAELEKVKRTGVVWFHCWGGNHPPVCISGTNPFRRTNQENVDAD
jgi:hypothetical protein